MATVSKTHLSLSELPSYSREELAAVGITAAGSHCCHRSGGDVPPARGEG